MPATLLDGKKIAGEIQAEIKQKVAEFVGNNCPTPQLAAVLVGEDPASHVYVRNKERACKRVGINSQIHRMPDSSSTQDILEKVGYLNSDSAVNGILVQLPLPSAVDTQAVLDSVDPDKDVDAFHPRNVGLISQGRPCFLPCTPHGILQLLMRYQLSAKGKNVVIVGRSDIVGKPMGMMLTGKDAGLGNEYANSTVTICHSRTQNLSDFTRNADIVIAAIGKPEFITGEMLKPGAIVIDVGINRTDDGLAGDVHFQSAERVASHITPVPGGVGPLTVTMLLENTLTAARNQNRNLATTQA